MTKLYTLTRNNVEIATYSGTYIREPEGTYIEFSETPDIREYDILSDDKNSYQVTNVIRILDLNSHLKDCTHAFISEISK